ncbi:PDZ domain-containing protein 9 isoform X1 [Huso huso]|uniref:PDZ domain-containing protein 9 isoform X1 n=1 Tax=Huso huso TaxID=61971 RepID=A0ABR0ZBA4_HUSHU
MFNFTVPKRPSCHELRNVLETDLQMGPHGLGLTVIENKHFLQITRVSQSSIAANNGVLQPGDVLIKIGSVEALGCKLREIMQQIKAIPVGTVLSIMVYRDYLLIPEGWERRSSPDKPSKSTTSCSIERCKEEADIIDEMQQGTAFQASMISLSPTRTESSTEVPSLETGSEDSVSLPRTLTVGIRASCDLTVHSEPEEFSLFDNRSIWRIVTDDSAPSSSSSSSLSSDLSPARLSTSSSSSSLSSSITSSFEPPSSTVSFLTSTTSSSSCLSPFSSLLHFLPRQPSSSLPAQSSNSQPSILSFSSLTDPPSSAPPALLASAASSIELQDVKDVEITEIYSVWGRLESASQPTSQHKR